VKNSLKRSLSIVVSVTLLSFEPPIALEAKPISAPMQMAEVTQSPVDAPLTEFSSIRRHRLRVHRGSYGRHSAHGGRYRGYRQGRHHRQALVYATVRRHARTASAGPVSAAFSGFGGSDVVSVARRYIGTNPTGRGSAWCGNFMNLVLERTGRRGSGSNLARSFASYGRRVSGPQVGAIAVMARRGGGHVGVVSGIDGKGNPIIISGNHGRRVAESVYSAGRIYAYVMP
jgi:uncharacterized protein (TIGR02594 family)